MALRLIPIVVELTLERACKKSSKNAVCIFLLTLFDLCKYGGKQEQSDQGPHCQKVAKTFQQMTEADIFCCDWHFKG